MKENFANSIALIIKDYEGGYSNDPHDPGGPTKYGVTIHDVRMYINPRATAENVKALTLSQAISIYRSKYADRINFDRLWWGLDFCGLDAGINSGTGKHWKWLKQALGLAQAIPNEKATEVAEKDSAAGKTADICRRFCDVRLSFLHCLGNWAHFGRGWGRRVANVRARSVAMATAHPYSGQPIEHPHVVVKRDADIAHKKATVTKGHAKRTAGGGAVTGGASSQFDEQTLILFLILAALLAGVALYFWWKSRQHAVVAEVAHAVAKEIQP